MNDDFADLETELRALQPCSPSSALEGRLAVALAAAPGRPIVSRANPANPSIPWWEHLGFHRPLAAFTWGLATPAAAVCAVLLLHVTGGAASRPALTVDRPVATQPLAATATAAAVPASGFEPTADSNVLYQTSDEGVVYNAQQQPERQVRYRSQETLAWRNPHTGTQVEVSYPREDVVLTPVSLR